MGNWIIVPDMNYDGIKQGTNVSTNPKDYVSTIRQEEREAAKSPGEIETIDPTQNRVKLNNVSITKKGVII